MTKASMEGCDHRPSEISKLDGIVHHPQHLPASSTLCR